MATIFGSVAVVRSLILPTYKRRIIIVPPLLVGLYWWVSSTSHYYNGFSIHPYMLLWITTFTATGLLIPQHSTVEFYFRRMLHAFKG